MINPHVSVLVGPKALISTVKEHYDVKIGSYEKLDNSVFEYCFGASLRDEIRKAGRIEQSKWDFLTIALAVSSADFAVHRAIRFDGWTRRIELTVAVVNPDSWPPEILHQLESCLMILTGDVWEIHVIKDGTPQAPCKKRQRRKTYKKYDSICLLSGGSDSLVGAIDLVSEGYHPLFVSETVKKSGKIRDDIITSLYGYTELSKMLRLSPNIKGTSKDATGEITTRSRSIRFIAYAIVASSLLRIGDSEVEIHIPENGFISINPPLTIGRLGSLSTKTTYPPYLDGLQNIFDSLGFNVRIISDYRFKTKGEMFIACKNKELLNELLPDAVSCGKIGRKQRACGKCVPCMVRRAAEYAYTKDKDFTERDTDNADLHDVLWNHDSEFNSDLSAMVYALKQLKSTPASKLYGAQLSFAIGEERKQYEMMLERGFAEIEEYLRLYGIDI